MSEYMEFAYIYDQLTKDVDYEKISKFIDDIIKKYCKIEKPKTFCDLACGTGTMCNLMHNKGYDVIGVDLSTDMLTVASKKSEGKNILYLNQDISNLELLGKVDIITCLLDSVNHITDLNDLKNLFKKADKYLNSGGLLIFDVNSPYKFNEILSDNIFTYDENGIFYVWESLFDKQTNICDFYLTFFVENENLYRRFDEMITQRCYHHHEIIQQFSDLSLSLVGFFGDEEFDSNVDCCHRLYYIFLKK